MLKLLEISSDVSGLGSGEFFATMKVDGAEFDGILKPAAVAAVLDNPEETDGDPSLTPQGNSSSNEDKSTNSNEEHQRQ